MERTFFYKNPRDGKIFACEQKEATLIHKKYEFIGSSDGSAFAKEVALSEQAYTRKQNELNSMSKRNMPVPTDFWKEYDEVKKLYTEALKRGFDLELESARGNLIPPQKRGITDLEGRPVDLSGSKISL